MTDFYGESIARCKICGEFGRYDAMYECFDPFKNDVRMRHLSCEE